MKYFTLAEWRSLKDPLNAGPHNLLRNGQYDDRTKAIKMITLHITAGNDGDNGAAGTTSWGANGAREASWAVCVGNTRIYTGLPNSKAGWTQGMRGFDFNQRGWGIEIAKRSTQWGINPSLEDGLLRMAAAACAPVVIQYGIPIRLERNRSRISSEINAGRAVGFTYHADLNPGQRTDPGIYKGRDTFPIEKFFKYVREEVALRKGGKPTTPPVTKPSTGGTAVLRLGSKGNAVKHLQSELNRWFPTYSKLNVDGSFGYATEKVIKEFQRRVDIEVDGIVGPNTKKQLAKFKIVV